MKLAIIILMIFALMCLLIISNNNLAFSDSKDFEKFSELLVEWLGKLFNNLKSITGEAVNMDWAP